MKPRFWITTVVMIWLATVISGCNTMPVQTAYGTLPQYCTQNNTATGAVVGTLLGAAIGAAAGGWRGAAIGGGSGLVVGSAAGAQADSQCRQLAYQQALEMAEAAQAQAMEQAATANAVPPTQIAYQSIDYVTPSTGVRHKVTPLNSYTNPATKVTCSTIDDVSFGDNGSASSSTQHKVCKSADGQLHET
jgi:uncharacterized membrane protein